MSDSKQLAEMLGLRKQPVAITFQDSPPSGIPKIEREAASSCAYWKLAAEGRSFYTESTDHHGCPIGAHTHGIEMPEETAKELEGVVGMMVELEYIDIEEVPKIPQLPTPFGVAVYSPLNETDGTPDVVLVTGSPRQMMLLAEASRAAGVTDEPSVVGRPTCAAIPAVIKSGQSATNLGCIGNRVYTELADDELYYAVAGSQLDGVVKALTPILHANRELASFHQERLQARS